ncbi:MAG: CDP-alcohol phosphatidyltransferase family protein, partial [Chloroflexota bacterium]
MLDQTTREIKERALRPIAIISSGIDPTAVTWVALVLGIGSAIFAAMGNFPAALILWAINRVLDGLDGTIARLNDKQSDLGGYI